MGGSWELAISWLDLAKIMVRSFCPCNTVVVCISYHLIGSLVALHNCGTHTLTGLVMYDHGTCVLTEFGCAHIASKL